MRKIKFIKDVKLEFHFNDEGLFIIGNQKGLSALADEIEKVARVKKSNYHHIHLNRYWDKLIDAGNFIINFDWINNKAKLSKRKKYDITVMHADEIGDELWNQSKDEPGQH